MAADYHYVSTWQLRAPSERVWTAISDLDHLPAWYPAVHDVQTLAPGDDQGVGARVRYVIKGRLPMRLAFEGTITRVDPPRELDLRAEGELEGTGRWDLDQQDGLTSARYTWDVFELINIFRYDTGRHAEEWIQTDNRSVLRQLGAAPRVAMVELATSTPHQLRQAVCELGACLHVEFSERFV